MDDRIGDLLAERARLGVNPAAGIAVSMLLHGSIAAGIIYAAMHAAAPQEVSTLSIKFVASGVGSRESRVVTPAPALAPTPDTRPPTPEKIRIPEPAPDAPKPVV